MSVVTGKKARSPPPFHMTVLMNDLDRFHLVLDTIDRLPQTGDKSICLK